MVTKELLIHDFKDGLNINEIALKYQTSKWMIYKYTSWFGIKVWDYKERKAPKIKSPKIKSEYCGEYGVLNEENLKRAMDDGLTTHEIAVKFNRTTTGLRSWAKRNKISLKHKLKNDDFWITKFKNRVKKFLKSKNKYIKKESKCKNWRLNFIYKKYSYFTRCYDVVNKNKYRINNTQMNDKYSIDELLEHMGDLENQTCYLTGRKINIKIDEYQLDHKVPLSRGGKSSLENMGLTCKEANYAKHNLTEEEFVELCKEVVIHHGYTITKNE